jgi:hypothetical protein
MTICLQQRNGRITSTESWYYGYAISHHHEVQAALTGLHGSTILSIAKLCNTPVGRQHNTY